MSDDMADRLLVAVADLIGRTGAVNFGIEYTTLEADDTLTAWLAMVKYDDDTWNVCAAPDPVEAAWRLLEQVIDGGRCTTCHRMTAVDREWRNPLNPNLLPAGMEACVYVFDPSTSKFIRGCEDGR